MGTYETHLRVTKNMHGRPAAAIVNALKVTRIRYQVDIRASYGDRDLSGVLSFLPLKEGDLIRLEIVGKCDPKRVLDDILNYRPKIHKVPLREG